MARTQIQTDEFNRAALGTTDWSQLNTTDAGSVVITSSTVITGQYSGLLAAARWIGSGTFTADQYSSIIISSGNTETNQFGVGVIVRASTDLNASRDYFYAWLSDNIRIGKVVNGTDTVLYTVAPGSTFAAGNRFELEVEGTSPSITLRLCKNGVALGGAFTLTGQTGPDTGNPGIMAMGTSTGIITGDSWDAGNVTSGGGGTSFTLTADVGTFGLTGQDATLSFSGGPPPGSYTLTADQGTYTLTGGDAYVDTQLTAEQGSYTLSGQDATLTVSTPAVAYLLTADQGSYILTGMINTMIWSGQPAIYSHTTGLGMRLHIGL